MLSATFEGILLLESSEVVIINTEWDTLSLENHRRKQILLGTHIF